MVSKKQFGASFLGLFSLALGLCICGLQGATAYADDYGVTAVVPYPAPTQPAVITQPADNSTVSGALQTISGTCELLSPQGVVSIWRGGTAIGSTVCNGTFNIPVMLQEGSNVLIARSASASGLYGPDSSSLTLILHLPPSMPSPTVSPPANREQTTIATNQATATGLLVTISKPFSTLDSSNSFAITLTISGGIPPYSIILNWGDGSVETHNGSKPGDYTFAHTYLASAGYIIRGEAIDAQGSAAQFSHAVVSTQKPSVVGQTKQQKAHGQGVTNHRTALPITLVGVIILLLISDYWLGWHRAAKHFTIQAKKKRKKRSAVKKRRKRKIKKSK